MSKIVRTSKYRHVFGTPLKPDLCYSDLKAQISAMDSNFIAANAKYFAVPWQSGGGGCIAVFRHDQTGKVHIDTPVFSGHTAQILDFAFAPFNDNILATGSEDTLVKIWGIPEGGLTASENTPLVNLEGHSRKVNNVVFHKTAANVLATTAFDFSVKLWDIEKGEAKASCTVHPEVVQSLSFNLDGSLMATTCKDKKLRIVDPRANAAVATVTGHEGAKGARVIWMGQKDRIFTVGFSKMSERQYSFWDPRDLTKPLITTDLDNSSGQLIPLYDEDTNILFLAGKGDGNIRYFECVDEAPYAHYLETFKSSSPQRGICMLPKLACDVGTCEIARLYKLEERQVTPITFQVPRKGDAFQEDIFPDTASPESVMTADQYFEGKNGRPKMVSMRPGATSFSASAFVPKVAPKTPVAAAGASGSTDPKLPSDVPTLQKRVRELEARVAELEAKLAAAAIEKAAE